MNVARSSVPRTSTSVATTSVQTRGCEVAVNPASPGVGWRASGATIDSLLLQAAPGFVRPAAGTGGHHADCPADPGPARHSRTRLADRGGRLLLRCLWRRHRRAVVPPSRLARGTPA